MKKTIDLTKEAVVIYDQWGHKKSEKVSQAIMQYEGKDTIDIRLGEIERRLKELEGKK